MAENAGTEIISPQQITQARRRLAPLTFQRFIPSERKADVPTGLSPAEVQDKCFSVLGYLEEYYNLPKHNVPEIKLGEDKGLQNLEKQLDNMLGSRNQAAQNADMHTDTEKTTGASGKTWASLPKTVMKHRGRISQKLSDLLAFPQVRNRFEQEFAVELAHYQAARIPIREVRDINRVTAKIKQGIYRQYLTSKQENGKLTQSAADQIGLLQRKLDELEVQKRGIEETASPSTAGYLETQKLLEYKRELKEKGFAMTPSRERLIDRITREALAGKKIFLVGSTGTGKTQLAFYVLDSLTGGYEIVPWHEGTTPRDIFGYRELYEDEDGRVQSGTKPGPYPRALEKKVGLVHEEFTGGSTRTMLSMKYLMGAKPGEKVHIPGFNGDVHEITSKFIELFTGNPKDERTKQREDMDPAILRELTGVEVSYMSAPEMDDIVRAMLIEENGVLKLSKSEADYVKKLSQAAEMMQRIHNRDFDDFSPEMKNLLGIDAQNNTETTLNTNFLDPGTLFKLFGEWELARARGQNFADYMGAKLGEFIKDPKTLSVPEEREALRKILHNFGLITSAVSEPQVKIKEKEDEKGYILPSEMAGQAVLSNENPMGSFGVKTNEEKSTLSAKEQRAKEILGKDFLGREAIKILEDKLKVVGVNVKFLLDKLPPSAYTEQDLQFAKENGEAFFTRPEEMIMDGRKVPVTINTLRELFEKDPLGQLSKVFFSQTWYDDEKFATQLEIDGVKQINLGSALVKKDVLAGSTNKTWNQQEEILKQYKDGLSEKGASNTDIRRRTAVETTWDSLLYYVNTGERLLSGKYDWGQTRASDGNLVCAGCFGLLGWVVRRSSRGPSNPGVGVCSSR